MSIDDLHQKMPSKWIFWHISPTTSFLLEKEKHEISAISTMQEIKVNYSIVLPIWRKIKYSLRTWHFQSCLYKQEFPQHGPILPATFFLLEKEKREISAISKKQAIKVNYNIVRPIRRKVNYSLATWHFCSCLYKQEVPPASSKPHIEPAPNNNI